MLISAPIGKVQIKWDTHLVLRGVKWKNQSVFSFETESWTHLAFMYVVYHTLPFSAIESVTRHCLFSGGVSQMSKLSDYIVMCFQMTIASLSCIVWCRSSYFRDQREWVFEVREVKSENKKLSLFFEKCKVKQKCFHSFSRSAKWNQNAFTLFREVKSEIKMLRDWDREVKILEISLQFSRNEICKQI